MNIANDNIRDRINLLDIYKEIIFHIVQNIYIYRKAQTTYRIYDRCYEVSLSIRVQIYWIMENNFNKKRVLIIIFVTTDFMNKNQISFFL